MARNADAPNARQGSDSGLPPPDHLTPAHPAGLSHAHWNPMTETEMPAFSNPGVYQRIEERLNRIEDKLDTRMTTLDTKVDAIKTRQDSLEGELRGAFGMLKWLGPTGVAAILFALLKSSGFLP